MVLVIKSVLCADVMQILKILKPSFLQLFVFITLNRNKADPSFTQLDTEEQVNILLYSYPPHKSNAFNQDIKFVIFLKNWVALTNH